MKFNLLIIICLSLFHPLLAENYLLNGGQKSTIRYKLIQDIEPTSETMTVNISFVIPQTFKSPTYNQTIKDLNISFSKNPDDTKKITDENQNQIIQYTWNQPKTPFKAEIAFNAENYIQLKAITSSDPFPPDQLPADIQRYIQGTNQVPVDNTKIKQKASELVRNSKTQMDAVQKIFIWIIDHRYQHSTNLIIS